MQAYLSPVAAQALEMELDGEQVRFVHRWTPSDGTPWGAMTIIHGFGDHGARFAGMATSLASLGLAVTAIDLIGHGRSPGRRGVIGSYDQMLDEVDRAVRWTEGLFPRIPQFLFGQSMGGNLVINWLLRRGTNGVPLRGAIVGSPMLKASNMPQEKIMNAGRWLAKRVPNLRIPTPVQVNKLSQNRQAQDAYLRDPWVHRSMSLRLAACLIDSGLWAIENASRLPIPMLLMHGTDDQLTCPTGTEEFCQRAGGLATYSSWLNCRHDLHDEPVREQVFAKMTDWLKSRCITSYRLHPPVRIASAPVPLAA
jgi:acylglycerol lipase